MMRFRLVCGLVVLWLMLLRGAVWALLGADSLCLLALGMLHEAVLFLADVVEGSAHLLLFLALQGVVEAVLRLALLLIFIADLLFLLAGGVVVGVEFVPEADCLVFLAEQVVVDAVLVGALQLILRAFVLISVTIALCELGARLLDAHYLSVDALVLVFKALLGALWWRWWWWWLVRLMRRLVGGWVRWGIRAVGRSAQRQHSEQ